MGFSLSGALAGAGGAAAEIGGAYVKEQAHLESQLKLEDVRNAALAERDRRVQEFQSKESALNRDLTREEGAAGRATTVEQGALTRQHQTAENAANRVLQVQLNQMQQDAANARHGASMGVQMAQLKATQEQVTLLPQADGTYQKVKKDGTILGLAVGPDGRPLQGPKDIAASTKLLVEGNIKIISHLEDAAAKSFYPAEKAQIAQRVQELTQQNKQLLGVAEKSGGVPSTKARDDPLNLRGSLKPATRPQGQAQTAQPAEQKPSVVAASKRSEFEIDRDMEAKKAQMRTLTNTLNQTNLSDEQRASVQAQMKRLGDELAALIGEAGNR